MIIDSEATKTCAFGSIFKKDGRPSIQEADHQALYCEVDP